VGERGLSTAQMPDLLAEIRNQTSIPKKKSKKKKAYFRKKKAHHPCMGPFGREAGRRDAIGVV